jgi:hypothetical protein
VEKPTEYYGFYTTKPFWVGEALSLENGSTCAELKERMATPALRHTNGDYVLHVCRDGMFVLRVESIERWYKEANSDEAGYSELGKYLNYMNCIILLFESALAEVEGRNLFAQELTTKEVIWVEPVDGRFDVVATPAYSAAEAFAGVRTSPLLQDTGREYWLTERFVLRREVFDRLFEYVDRVVGDYRHVLLMAQLMKSLSEYRIPNKETSLILSWFVIETFLQKKWKHWLCSKNQAFEDGSKRINRDRFKDLTEGRDYPISVVSSILELSDVISFSMYKNINYVRGIRNDIVHQEEERKCTYADCQLALQIATSFMSDELGSPLNLTLSFPMYWW